MARHRFGIARLSDGTKRWQATHSKENSETNVVPFLTYFRAFSYAMIAVAMLALVLAGGLSVPLALVFLAVMIVSWMLENTKWQLPERYGLGIVLLSIPLFYVDWQYQKAMGEPAERLGVTALAHLIVFLVCREADPG